MPTISIVIPVFNSRPFIELCINSLFAQDYQDFEVIIVDNNSKDGTADFVKTAYPRIILIENKQNFGACRARNQGIEASSGSWVLTLDCDVVLEKDFIPEACLRLLSLSAGIGAMQPKILNLDKKTIFSCGIFLSGCFRRFYDIGCRQPRENFNTARDIFGPCSAAAFYSRKMLDDLKEKTGYFDERFFFLVEDVDLAWRSQRKGWKAVYCPEVVCYHAGNSSGLSRKLRQYLCFRNRWCTIKKNEGLIRYSLRILPLFFYDLPRYFYLLLSNLYLVKHPALNR